MADELRLRTLGPVRVAPPIGIQGKVYIVADLDDGVFGVAQAFGDVPGTPAHEKALANADFIALAWNTHDELVVLCRKLIDVLEGIDDSVYKTGRMASEAHYELEDILAQVSSESKPEEGKE